MAKFTMNRDFVVSGMGYSIAFAKDVPIEVPAPLQQEAMRCGAVPANPDDDIAHVEGEKGREAVILGADREKALIAAMDKLVEENARMSFGADGLPTTKALFRLTGIEVDLNERNDVWQKRVRELRANISPNSETITEKQVADAATQQRERLNNAADVELASKEASEPAPQKAPEPEVASKPTIKPAPKKKAVRKK